MWEALLACAVVALVIWLSIGGCFYLSSCLDRRPPSPPWSLPLVGHLHRLDPSRPYLSLASMALSLGPIYRLSLGRVETVVLSQPALIRQALAKEELTARADLYLTHGIMQGYGLIVAEGERWREQRKFVLSWLKKSGMVKIGSKRDHMEKRIMDGVHETFKMIDDAQGGKVDAGRVLLHCLGNILNLLIFGRKWDLDDPTWKWLQHLAEQGVKLIGVAGPLNFLPFLRWLPSYRRTLNFIMEGKSKTHELYKEVVWKESCLNEECIASAFIAEMGKGGNSFTETQLYHLLADLWGAGVDTTMTTLRWYLLMMALHPQIQEQVQEELDTCLESDKEPTLDDLPKLPLTEASLAETQRIRPVTPLGIPHASKVDTDIGGYEVKKGTMVIPLQWAVHMDPKAWEQPERFQPDRFLDSDGKFTKREHFMPFQTGKRACVGEEMARMMLFLFGSGLLRRYTVLLDPEDTPSDVTGDCGITLTPPQHTLRFIRRQQS